VPIAGAHDTAFKIQMSDTPTELSYAILFFMLVESVLMNQSSTRIMVNVSYAQARNNVANIMASSARPFVCNVQGSCSSPVMVDALNHTLGEHRKTLGHRLVRACR